MVVNLPPIARLGIAIKTNLVERHNLILADMLYKVLEETYSDLELAAVWCVNAKNSLSNIHSFFPYQLAIGTNPKLPSMMSNRATALTATPSKVIICINLKAIHKVMEAFTPNENSQKIRRALAHNIRTSGDQIHYRRPCLLQTCRQQRMAWPSQSIRQRWATSSRQK